MGKLQTKSDDKLGVKLTGTFEKGQHITLNQDAGLQAIFGTQHPELAEALMTHCLKVLKSTEASDGHPGNDERFFMLGAIAELKPRDVVERMLAVQMAATHVAMIRSGRWLANADTMDQVQAHYSGYTKLARTYTAQMEALRKHRNGGKQTVTVQHVNVEDGGNAIVGNVSHGGRGADEK